MRAALLACLLVVACSSAATSSASTDVRAAPTVVADTPAPAVEDVNGTLSVERGTLVLRVWGTPRELGHAHGYLLRDRILQVIDGYALDAVPPATLAAAGAVLERAGAISPSLREEAEGIVEGMRAAGGARVERLDRELGVGDLLALNAMTDLIAVGCSSVSAWGAALDEGGPTVVRNLDWSDDPELLANQVVIVTMPDDPARQPLVSVAFAGYIGCLSCMNESGVVGLFNMGYGDGAASPATLLGGFAPANLLLRDALELRDPDADGRRSADDVEHVVRAAKHVGSYIVHVVEPLAPERAPARVLEVESDGVATRRPGEDALRPELLAATNHLRTKAEPRACDRYDRVVASSRRNRGGFSRDELWRMVGELRLPEVVHTIRVDVDARRIGVWLRSAGERDDVDVAPVLHEWDALVRRR